MNVIIGIILWVLIGFCTYLWTVKITHITCFYWYDFLISISLGLIGLIIILICLFISNFKNFMEKLIKKINK